MDAREIAKEIYYVGVNDRVTELFEALWPLPYGVSYNSYIVRGSDKTALIDTVKIDEVRQFLDNVKGVEQKAVIDYLVIRVFSLMFRKTSFKTPENIIKARA